MNTVLNNFKVQLQANKAKSAILGGLLIVGGVILIHSYTAPSAGSAAGLSGRQTAVVSDPVDPDAQPVSAQEIQDRMTQSKALWQVLQEKRGMSPANAFAFDAAYYTLDPAMKPAVPEPVANAGGTQIIERPTPAAPVPDERMRVQLISEQAKALVLQSTVLGAHPIAVISTGVYRVDDHVGGFRVVAIRAREVVVEKDGITLTIEMAK